MKDIYELLNDVDIDESEIKTMDVPEFEKANVKKSLKKSIKKNNGWKKKSLVAAALCCVVIGSIGAVGITNPAYAAEIPIVGDIFRLLDNGRTGVYDKYKENANEINVTKESNGTAITIKDAIFDGKTITYTYEIKSDKNLGQNPCTDIYNSMKNNKARRASCHIEKVDKNTYIGREKMTIYEDQNEINLKLNITKIEPAEENDAGVVVNGKWNFDINLKAIENKKQIINNETEKDGVKASIDSISKSQISFVVNYSQKVPKEVLDKWSHIYLDIQVKDDLGNIYKGEDDGGEGDGEGKYTTWNTKFGKLNENATKLRISPIMFLSHGGRASIDENGDRIPIKRTTDSDDPRNEVIIFDDIVVDLEK